MNELKKMEVGKLYKAVGSKHVVKALAKSSQGDTFVEVVGDGDRVGFTFIIKPKEGSYNWKEYTEPKKLYINVFKYGKQEYTNCYNTIEDADKAKDQYSTYKAKDQYSTYHYVFIKRIETEI